MSKKRNEEKRSVLNAGDELRCNGRTVVKVLKGCANIVQPTVDGVCLARELQPWEVTDWANYKGIIQPIPSCPDGRYRPHSKAPGQKREPVKH